MATPLCTGTINQDNSQELNHVIWCTYNKQKGNSPLSNMYRGKKKTQRKCPFFFRLGATCPYAATRTELVPASPLPLPQQQHCRCHRHSVRDEQSGSNSQLLHFSSSLLPFPSTHLSSHLLVPLSRLL